MAIRVADLDPRHTAPPRASLRVVGASPQARPGRATFLRRRLVVALALAVLCVVVAAALRSPADAQAATTVTAAPSPAPVVVVLGPGETLWTALSPYTPAGTTRSEWIHDVLTLNDVDARRLAPGAVLRLPGG